MKKEFYPFVLLKYIKNVDRYVKAYARSLDPEALHKLRTNMRRLRNALWLFRDLFPRQTAKRWDKLMRSPFALSGEMRDTDVLIGFLEKYSKTLKQDSEKKQIKILSAQLKNEREQLNKEVKKNILRWHSKGAGKQIKKFLDKLGKAKIKEYSAVFPQIAKKKTGKRIKQLTDFEKRIRDDENSEQLHRMRISAKKLRYVMEAVQALYDPRVKKYIKQVLQFQRILGSIHDHDVWVAWLGKLISRHRRPEGSERSLLKLRGFLVRQREKEYERFLRLWEKCREKRFFEKMSGFIKSAD